MKCISSRLLAVALLLCGMVAAQHASAQTKTYRVQAEAAVVGNNLQVDFYIQRIAGSAFSLASSNFVLQFGSGAGLDLANADVITARSGPWDSQTDSRGYNQMNLSKRADYISLNVNCKSFFKSQNPGPGQPVGTTRTQIGRIVVPITDPTSTATMSWMTGPMAVMNWSGTNVKDQGIFELVTSSIPLCSTPAAPTLSFAAQTTYCQGNTVTLTSSFNGTHQWYANGQPIVGQTGNTLTVSQSGAYTAAAVVGTCTSTVSAAATFNFVSTQAPVVSISGRQLVSSIGSGIQWHYQGQPIAGATTATYTPDRSGRYKAVLTNACGAFSSNEVEWLLGGNGGGDPGPPIGGGSGSNGSGIPTVASASVYPNPYVGNTTLSYALPKDQEVTIMVSNAAGIPVGRVLKQSQKIGRYTFGFSARELGLPAGTYFIKVTSDDINTTFKVMELQ
jgi:hypothetical protein